jgi:peptidoglycan/xylan/chitin deacetylase (PgdA/CDA1 family)
MSVPAKRNSGVRPRNSAALRYRVRDALAAALWTLGVTRPGRAARGRLTIVTFHRVLPAPARRASPLPGLVVTPEALADCLGFFGAHFTCLRVSDAWRRFSAGERGARPLLAITFDDGRLDGWTYARPLLARHGVPATFYVPAGYVGAPEPLWPDGLAHAVAALERRSPDAAGALRDLLGEAPPDLARGQLPKWAANVVKDFGVAERDAFLAELRALAGPHPLPDWERAMGWRELADLARDGHEIGSHSLTHAVLRDGLGADLRAETAGSRALLEGRLGCAVESFCFPSGLYDESTLREVRAAGYTNAVTTRTGSNRAGASAFELARFDVEGERNMRDGRAALPALAWRLAERGL